MGHRQRNKKRSSPPEDPPKKRPSPLEDPPKASSLEEEEKEEHVPSSQHEEEEEEEEASSEEDEQPSKIPPTNSHSKPSSSESDSETDSDSEPDPHPPTPAANPKVKPLASKPMEHSQKPKPQPSPKSGSKRPIENHVIPKNSPKAKKKSTDSSSADAAASSDDEKKLPEHSKKFQRLWSEEDEINILKGVTEFTHKTGQDPSKYPTPFHDFMKKSLHVDASSTQLKDKVRRLKKKFGTNAGKGKNGEAPSFLKPHEQKVFELSKMAWGGEPSGANGAVERTNSNVKAPSKQISGRMDIDEKADGHASLLFSEMSRCYRNGEGVNGLNEDDLKRGLELMEESKRAELGEKWKKLRLAEMELFSDHALLVGEQTRLIFEALSSNN